MVKKSTLMNPLSIEERAKLVVSQLRDLRRDIKKIGDPENVFLLSRALHDETVELRELSIELRDRGE